MFITIIEKAMIYVIVYCQLCRKADSKREANMTTMGNWRTPNHPIKQLAPWASKFLMIAHLLRNWRKAKAKNQLIPQLALNLKKVCIKGS